MAVKAGELGDPKEGGRGGRKKKYGVGWMPFGGDRWMAVPGGRFGVKLVQAIIRRNRFPEPTTIWQITSSMSARDGADSSLLFVLGNILWRG